MSSDSTAEAHGERLQKFLARAGVASRRKCEELIVTGRVKVNGKTVTELGAKVVPEKDLVTVDDVAVRTGKPLYLIFHKPKNCVCTSRDEHGRRTVLDFLSGIAQRIYTVGRLDYDAEGLLILTNDGDFAERVIHPRYGMARRYQVTVKGYLSPEAAETLRKGVTLDGKRIRPLSLRVVSRGNRSSRLEMELCQGINQQIKRMLWRVGYEVTAIRRTRIGGVELGNLGPGKFRRMTLSEKQSLEQHEGSRRRATENADDTHSSAARRSRKSAMRRQ